MHGLTLTFILFFVTVVPPNVQAARILGFFPHPGKSHFDVFKVYMEGLAEKGHNVTVVSFFPHSAPPNGYEDISLVGLYPIFVDVVSFETIDSMAPEWVDALTNYYLLSTIGLETCSAILPSEQYQELLKRRGDFDLVVMEQFNTDCFMSLVHKLEVPFIGFSSCLLLPYLHRRLGVPLDPSHIANAVLGTTDQMTFKQRVENFLMAMITTGLYYPLFDRPAQKLVQKYVGEIPALSEISRNTSLMLINTHFTLHQPKPFGPKVVEVGGIHVEKERPLPQDLDKFLSESTHGAILFSFGSMLKPGTLPEEKVNAFLSVFWKIPQRVVWRFNGTLENVPSNVKIMPWIPQRDILAHEKIIGFLAHGGLLGLTEAMYCGKPVLATPMFGDQRANVRAAVQAGFAVELPFRDISAETVSEGIQLILSEKYQKRAKEFSTMFHDRPLPPLESAIYWTEYVIKYGGQPLHTGATDLNIFQYYMIDIACLFIGLFLVILYIAMFLLNCLRQVKGKKHKLS